MAGWSQAAQGQAPQGQARKDKRAATRKYKDQQEHDLFTASSKETDPNKKLGFLESVERKISCKRTLRRTGSSIP